MEHHDLKHISWARVFELLDKVNRPKCRKLYEENREKFDAAPGSKGKHQAWPGGYIDHICETVGIAEKMFETLRDMRPVDFSLSDAVVVLFMHDLEKPFKYERDSNGKMSDKPKLATMELRKEFVRKLLAQYEIKLTEAQDKAYQYIEGEGNDYNPHLRIQTPLGAFCHCCDTISARIWFNYPRIS